MHDFMCVLACVFICECMILCVHVYALFHVIILESFRAQVLGTKIVL
jgi:hypothetical protein